MKTFNTILILLLAVLGMTAAQNISLRGSSSRELKKGDTKSHWTETGYFGMLSGAEHNFVISVNHLKRENGAVMTISGHVDVWEKGIPNSHVERKTFNDIRLGKEMKVRYERSSDCGYTYAVRLEDLGGVRRGAVLDVHYKCGSSDHRRAAINYNGSIGGM